MSMPSNNSEQNLKASSATSGGSTSRPGSASDRQKRLPSIPSPDLKQVSHIARVMPANKASTDHGPFLQEYILMMEYNLLATVKIPGIYVIPSGLSPYIWNGVLFVRQGIYEGGVFKFHLSIPENFPDTEMDCPSVTFEVPVFHPLIDASTGVLDVKKGFPKWRQSVNHIWNVLMYVRRIFHKFETKNPLNQEAADQYEQDLEGYKQRAKESVQTARERLYDPGPTDDPYAIRFSDLDPAVHEDALKEMSDSKSNHTEGLSWVSFDSPTILFRKDQDTA